MKQNNIPVPEWHDKPASEWPATARNAYGILAMWAERDQAARCEATGRRGDSVAS